jgi:hypothetical protein
MTKGSRPNLEEFERIVAMRRDNPALGDCMVAKITGWSERTIQRIRRDTDSYRQSLIKEHAGVKNVAAIAEKYGFLAQSSPAPIPTQPKDAGSLESDKRADSVVLAIPDMHHPFCHPDALPFLLALRDRVKPTAIVCLGDEIDAHALSKYPKNPDGLSAGQEFSKAREALYPFYKAFPEVLVCESNHTVRGHKKGYEAGLPASFLHTIATVLDAPEGWRWANRHEVDGVLYIHGDSGRSGQYAHIHYTKAFKKSVVIGHMHSYAGVNYEGAVFGMNAGCLINSEAYCFAYAKNFPVPVSLGAGVVYDGKIAVFVPMITDSHGRWLGKLSV